jgi:hypothetical protein
MRKQEVYTKFSLENLMEKERFEIGLKWRPD